MGDILGQFFILLNCDPAAFDLDKGTDFPLSKAVLADAVADSRAEHLDKHSCPHCHKFAGKKFATNSHIFTQVDPPG